MTRDELEFRISQSLDGLLGPRQQAELDEVLARDPEARRLADEYAALDAAMKSAPLPAMNLAAMQDRIARNVADLPEPQESYRLPVWAGWPARIAVAACLAIGLGAWLWLGDRPAQPQQSVAHAPVQALPDAPVVAAADAPVQPAVPAGPAIMQLAVMTADASINLSAVEVSGIGPAPGSGRINLPVQESIRRPSSAVAIDSAVINRQDNEYLLFR